MDFLRLFRSVGDLLSNMKQLEERGVRLVSLKESIDTHRAAGKLMTTTIAAINEFDRDNLLERQREGIVRAKAKGVYKGRKQISKPKNWQEIYSRYMNRKITANKAMELLELKGNVFYNFVKQEKGGVNCDS